MADTPTPTIFYWIKDNWTWLSALAVAAGTVLWILIKTFILDKIKVLMGILRIIPPVALEKGLMLQTEDDCNNRRSACSNHIITEELTETMRIIKQAIYLLVSHNKEIPQAERDKIVKELMQ